jgi:hypothetical protein
VKGKLGKLRGKAHFACGMYLHVVVMGEWHVFGTCGI